MQPVPKSDIADIRAALKDANYDAETLTALLGSSSPPDKARLEHYLARTRQLDTLNALVHLFLIGSSMDRSSVESVLQPGFVENCLRNKLLAESDGKLLATIVLVPMDDLVFASDAFRKTGSDEAGDFVVPASTQAGRHLLNLTIRKPVGKTLDLACGCGVHALYAAKHSEQVIATDLSDSAVEYTRFNAVLNGIENIECRQGNLFEPVSGETFDLIVCNPPFVIGPGERYVYRDNPMELDAFCAEILRQSSAYLSPGASIQMLCEWVEVNGESWQERIAAWGQGRDTWVLHSPASRPEDYVSMRRSDISGEQVSAGSSESDWLAYFAKHKVSAIHPGMILLRNTSEQPWFRLHRLVSTPTENIGDAIASNLESTEFSEICRDDDVLLNAVLMLSPQLIMEQRQGRADGNWDEPTVTISLDGGLPMTTEVDLPILVFLNTLDGARTLAECIDAFCTKTGADHATLTPQLLPAIRIFISNGHIEAA